MKTEDEGACDYKAIIKGWFEETNEGCIFYAYVHSSYILVALSVSPFLINSSDNYRQNVY